MNGKTFLLTVAAATVASLVAGLLVTNVRSLRRLVGG